MDKLVKQRQDAAGSDDIIPQPLSLYRGLLTFYLIRRSSILFSQHLHLSVSKTPMPHIFISLYIFISSLGRGTTIHLRIGHPYISPADARPSNGFGSLACYKDAAVVVPVVAAVGRTPSSESCIMYSLTACACYSSSGGPHASGQIWPQWRSPNVH